MLMRVRKRKDITDVWNLKSDTDEHTHKPGTASQTQRTGLWPPRGSLGLAGANLYIYIYIYIHTHIHIYRLEKQQGPTV